MTCNLIFKKPFSCDDINDTELKIYDLRSRYSSGSHVGALMLLSYIIELQFYQKHCD